MDVKDLLLRLVGKDTQSALKRRVTMPTQTWKKVRRNGIAYEYYVNDGDVDEDDDDDDNGNQNDRRLNDKKTAKML